MKHKLKKIFENAIWWSGVIMIGLILGISLQFVKAWTEPSAAPPGGNVGAPINTGLLGQIKQGVLQVAGLTVFNDPAVSGVDVKGKVLTAQNANGAVAWAAGGGGGCYVDYSLPVGASVGTTCKVSGFAVQGSAGKWGYCRNPGLNDSYWLPRPPLGACPPVNWTSYDLGEAYVCCK
jgi:hypothetical protein